jgi:site-specific DNA recombinase
MHTAALPTHPLTDVNSNIDLPEVDLLVRKSQVVHEGERALSLRAQEDRGRRWAAEEGYRVRKVWKENLSAYSDVQRPKYDAAMAALEIGEVPALWCYALDRFSRKGAGAVLPILDAGRRIVFDYEQLDSSRERDRRWIIQRAEDAREYSQRLSYNVRSTKERQRREGRWLGRAPFGLVADKETRRLSPDMAPRKGSDLSPWAIVLRIFAEIAGGKSARSLARTFNAGGIGSASGRTWRADTIHAIIAHPAYEGWLTVSPGKAGPVPYLDEQGQRVRCVERATVRRMVPAELAARARRVLSGHQIIDSTPRPGRAKALLASRLRCASCGSSMVANGNSYKCQSYSSGSACAAQASVLRTTIEAWAVDRWLARLSSAEPDDDLLAVVAERWAALTRPVETADVREATAALRAAEAVLSRFHEDDRAGFYAGRSARYRLPAKREAEERVTAAEERVAALSPRSVDVSFLLNGDGAGAWEAADETLRRDLFGLAVDTITVSKAAKQGMRFDGDSRCEIHWAEIQKEAA